MLDRRDRGAHGDWSVRDRLVHGAARRRRSHRQCANQSRAPPLISHPTRCRTPRSDSLRADCFADVHPELTCIEYGADGGTVSDEKQRNRTGATHRTARAPERRAGSRPGAQRPCARGQRHVSRGTGGLGWRLSKDFA